jgi:hypothetical protein
MSDARRVIEQAAQYIADNPHDFNFQNPFIPRRQGRVRGGCALGWIGYFQEQRKNFFARLFARRRSLDEVARSLGFASETTFYNAMTEKTGSTANNRWGYTRSWQNNAYLAVKGMREIAKEVA